MKYLISFLLSIVCMTQVWAKDVPFEAAVTRNKTAVGGNIQLNLTFNNIQNMPALDLPDIDGFSVRYVGPSSSMSIVNGVTSSSVTHIYLLQAVKEGKFTLGPFEFEYEGDKYMSNAVSVEVLSAAAGPGQTQADPGAAPEQADIGDISEKVFLVLEAGKKTLYVNESSAIKVRLYVNRTAIRDIQFPQIKHEGFSIGQFSQPKQYQDVVGGVYYDVIEFEAPLFALKPGAGKIGPASLECNIIIKKQGRRRPASVFGDDFFDSNVFDDFFGRYETRPVTLNSRAFPVIVSEIPQEGRPAGFTGGIGSFSMDVSVSPEEVKTGDPVTVRTVIRGTGNFNTVNIEKFETNKDFKAYEPQIKQTIDSKTIEQVVMPLDPRVMEIPAVSFSFFNAESGVYETVTRGPFPIKVIPQESSESSKVVEAGVGVSMAPSTAEKFGRDLIYIKDSPGRMSGPFFLYEKNLFKAVQTLFFFLYLGILGIYMYFKRLSKDTVYARKLMAPGKARSGITAAKKLLKNGDVKGFYDKLFVTMRDYLGDRFHLASKSITADIIDTAMKPRGVDGVILDKLSGLFRDCDLARYAPSSLDPSGMAGALKDLEEIIDYFQRGGV